ncbi:hypothetical protein M8X74_004455 [Salmonella enterica]|nr:hypothetical protein [Salmonella enterica]EJF5825966.1 hypothetical protein [Salmonella enterica]EJF5844800.1 hypothetical protein [Salmonella enterica]EJF5917294.1 hypothetical protein [Salmonella enterica]EJF6115390.1 hypothetical protein [Salmonella enterica]
MSVLELLRLLLGMFLFDLHQSVFRAICEPSQNLKNSLLFLKVKYFFDKVLEFEKGAFSNNLNAN